MSYYCCNCGNGLPTRWVIDRFTDTEIENGIQCQSYHKTNEQLNKGKGED